MSADVLVDRLFIKFAAMYGKHWLDMWVGQPLDVVKTEWARQLQHVAPDQVRTALESMMSMGQKFPPTLPEFFSLCQQFRKQANPLRAISSKGDEPAPEFLAKLRQIVNKS